MIHEIDEYGNEVERDEYIGPDSDYITGWPLIGIWIALWCVSWVLGYAAFRGFWWLGSYMLAHS